MRVNLSNLLACSFLALAAVAGCTGGTSNSTTSPAAVSTPISNYTEQPSPAPNMSGFVLAGAGMIDSSLNFTPIANPAPCGVTTWLGGAWQAITFGSFGTFTPPPSSPPDIFDRSLVWSGVYALSNGDTGLFFVRAPKVVSTPAPVTISAASNSYETAQVNQVYYGAGGCTTFSAVTLQASGGSGKIALDNGVTGTFTLGAMGSQSAHRQPRTLLKVGR